MKLYRKVMCVGLAAAFALVATVAQAAEPTNAELLKMIQDLQGQVTQLQGQLAAKSAVIDTQTTKISDLDAVTMRQSQMLQQAQRTGAVSSRDWTFGVLAGVAGGPYDTDSGEFIAGYLDVPIVREDPWFGNKISGEIVLGMSRHNDDYATLTSPLSALVPSMVGKNVDVDLDAIQVLIDGKYTFMNWEEFKPYVTAGVGVYVFAADYDNDWVAGIAPLPVELEKNHMPAGNADTELGLNVGTGFDYMLNDIISLGLDARWHFVSDTDTSFGTLAANIGLHF